MCLTQTYGMCPDVIVLQVPLLTLSCAETISLLYTYPEDKDSLYIQVVVDSKRIRTRAEGERGVPEQVRANDI